MVSKQHTFGNTLCVTPSFIISLLIGVVVMTLLPGKAGANDCPCTAGDNKFNCDGKDLSSVPSCAQSTSQRHLFLNNNNISSLPNGTFDKLKNLQGLHLKNNPLTSLPSGIFDQLGQLQALVITDTNLTTLPDGVFDGLTSLTQLYLYNNQLTSLPRGVFGSLSNLIHLLLNANLLTSLPDRVFDRLTKLTKLTLDHNQLNSLQNGTFDDLTLLRRLELQENQLTSLPDGVFKNLVHLFELKLQGNQFNSLPDGVFNALTSLFKLELQDNQLTSLPNAVFKKLAQLNKLDMSNNNLTYLRTGAFSALLKLQTLWLNGNQLQTLDVGVFNGLTALTELYLNNNNLTYLPTGTFSALLGLQTLRLNNNQLQSLEDGVFDQLTGLTNLSTNNNPWSCGPSVCQWLPLDAVKNKQITSFTGSCHSSCCTNSSLPGCPATQYCSKPLNGTDLKSLALGCVTGNLKLVKDSIGATCVTPFAFYLPGTALYWNNEARVTIGGNCSVNLTKSPWVAEDTCNFQYSLVNTTTELFKMSIRAGSCPRGQDAYQGFCYNYHPTQLSFGDATQTCANTSGLVLTIESQGEADFLLKHYRTKGQLFLGLRLQNDSSFKWANGKLLNAVGYSNWVPGKPDTSTGNECVEWIGSQQGQWDNVLCSLQREFICKTPVNCGSLPTPKDGFSSLTGLDGTFGETATFSCKAGFRLQGNSQSTCGAKGTWSSPSPVCNAVNCGSLPTPKDGFSSLTCLDGTFGETTTFSCKAGFRLQGYSQSTCGAKGTWSNPSPVCNEINECTESPHPCMNNGTCHNSVGDYICVCSTEFTGKHCETDVDECTESPDLCMNNGTCQNLVGDYMCFCPAEFTGKHCETDINCGFLETPMHGFSNFTGLNGTLNEVAAFSCKAGFQLQGSSESTCTSTGSWSSSSPACNDIDECTQSPDPCMNNGTCHNSVGDYICVCSAEFTGKQCETELECSLPNTPINGFINVTDTTLHSIASFSCQDGYTLQGSSQSICLVGFTWSDPTPVCNVVDCGPLQAPKHGFSVASGSALHATAVLSCEAGFALQGSSPSTCTVDGTWSNPYPICNDIDECRHSPPPCTNNGTCHNGVGDYICVCSAQFTGKHCESSVDADIPIDTKDKAESSVAGNAVVSVGIASAGFAACGLLLGVIFLLRRRFGRTAELNAKIVPSYEPQPVDAILMSSVHVPASPRETEKFETSI